MTQDNTTTAAKKRTPWDFTGRQRWKISIILETKSPLHIGSGETREITLTDDQGNIQVSEIKTIISDVNHGENAKPIIPGSTLKGKLLAWCTETNADKGLIGKVFGKAPVDEHNQGRDGDGGEGGSAEFHDALLIRKCTDGDKYPHWNEKRQVFLEASTAINRHTRTALDASLRHTECVPPGICFNIIVTGDMTEQEAALVIRSLQNFQDEQNTLCLGADTANGKGRMLAIEPVEVKRLDHQAIMAWLKVNSAETAPRDHFRKLDAGEIKVLVDKFPKFDLQPGNNRNRCQLTLKFDGPFIVCDPDGSLCGEQDDKERTNIHQPLIDKDDQPIFPVTSFRGALRAQAERIIRTMGGHCCDTTNPCRKDKVADLCLACQLFGATGWKTTLHIDQFSFVTSLQKEQQQHFVAIDRFHGGGKDSALFSACYFENPVFRGAVTLDVRGMDESELSWRRGLLALLFRDLQEGDITFGFGRNKGYGGIREVIIEGWKISTHDIKAFRDKLGDQGTTHACLPVTVLGSVAPQQTPNGQVPEDGNLFHNPYHFIPAARPDVSLWLDKEMLAQENSAHSHAWYRSATDSGQPLHHGRIICKLTAETPFFVGKGDAPEDQQDEGGAKLKESYRLNNELAIPATSLRGMISSLAEAASNSAMRVLEDKMLSYRKAMDPRQLLSAIGIVSKRGNSYHLVPLAMPTLKRVRRNNYYQLGNEDYNYQLMFPDGPAKLKVYLDNAYSQGAMKSFLDKQETWTLRKNKIFYLPLRNHQMRNGRLEDNETLRKPSGRRDFVIGQKSLQGYGVPVAKREQGWTPGILRILGKDHRHEDIPNTKKHELFIPVPEEFVNDAEQYLQTAVAFPIPSEVIDKFEKIAALQTASQKQENLSFDEERLPFHLKGTAREADHALKIKHGDIVYFRPNRKGDQIGEISFSSIWRDIAVDTVYDFLPHSELQPFNRSRNKISPAELLFGFVELNDEGKERDHSRCFAGKVRVNAARLAPEFLEKDEQYLLADEVMLKALSTPKPPSPALYFNKKEGEPDYIAKADLNAGSHRIQGRKIYLHALRKRANSPRIQKINAQGMQNDGGKYPWVSQDENKNRDKLRVRIRPLKEETSFFFSVEFDNLTKWELGLLCYALRPGERFRHKLGMGKPIGLGTVRIDIAALQTIDRQQRYLLESNGDSRYNKINWIKASLVDELRQTAFNIGVPIAGSPRNSSASPDSFREVFAGTIRPEIRQAMELLGDPGNIRYPVHYPQVDGADIENENFKWFVANDFGSGKGSNKIDPKHQCLQPLIHSDGIIPTLERYTWHDD